MGFGCIGDVLVSWYEGVDVDLVVFGKVFGGGMVFVLVIVGCEVVIGVF